MKKTVLITGANGMLSKHLANQLEDQYTIRFLTRKVANDNEYLWDLSNKYIDPKALEKVDTIIHLAGSPISEKWTTAVKKRIYSSRIDTSNLILEKLKEYNLTIDNYISASAIGYYGTITSETIFNEESKKGNDFLSDICEDWEKAAYNFKTNNIAKRIAIVRTGIILAKNDGALQKIVQPIKLGAGSGIGSGKQYMPWIHIQDLSNIFHHILDNKELEGIYNGVAPEHITNSQITKNIAEIINRPLLLPNVPKFAIKLLFGEMGIILLNGSRVSSKKIKKTGFEFQYGKLDDALKDVLI